jgi:hypothetical protein
MLPDYSVNHVPGLYRPAPNAGVIQPICCDHLYAVLDSPVSYPAEVIVVKARVSSERLPVPRARKNRKLDAAKRVLGAATETATIDAALDLVVFRSEVFEALDRVVATGGLAPIARTRRAG